MRNDSIDLVLCVLIFRKHFSAFHFLDNAVYKLETLSVLCFYSIFIMQVDIRLHIRRFLTFPL